MPRHIKRSTKSKRFSKRSLTKKSLTKRRSIKRRSTKKRMSAGGTTTVKRLGRDCSGRSWKDFATGKKTGCKDFVTSDNESFETLKYQG